MTEPPRRFKGKSPAAAAARQSLTALADELA
jgi:hypothetical protein